ncbi:U3 small nucleolar RNA-associated protein 4 homolog isoform X2 [Amblyraja radiata]|uniref:U3 small nucleolar RNA-associated protein 4 homolog isoform X2 n=1 Tax=Amblyraja radiata TaxID=386614 RepID=UPI001402D475|nr:U3 small nucleolar RNA-associated protein 4 homolog isoform X2 [Amblyraja radiata]
MGEYRLHRVRFFDLVPSAVRGLAHHRAARRLGLARADGSLEFFNFASNFVQEKVIPGDRKRLIEAISWIGQDRLVSVGLSGEIIEYDLQRLCPKYSLDAFGGPLWCMGCNCEETHLAVGCEDGSVKLFEIVPEKLQFERNLDRQKGRVLSLAWHKSGTMIVTGSLDTIRVLDVKSGHCKRHIRVDRGDITFRNRKCVIWAVGFLSDFSVVSADSAGKMQFWDWKTGTLLKTHPVTKCDVLSMSVNESEDSIAVGTAEGTVVQFQRVAVQSDVAGAQWVRTKTFKHHTHDVRAVVHAMSALVSGGVDAQLVIRPLMDQVEIKSYETALRKILFPHRNLVCCSRTENLLLFHFPEQLELWRLGSSQAAGAPGDVLPVSKKPDKLLELKSKSYSHIRCCALSPCGTWIASSTIYKLRLYRIQYKNDSININTISRFTKTLPPAHRLLFSADSTRLFVASDHSQIQVVDLTMLGSKSIHSLAPKSDCLEPVCLLAVSADGSWLAAASYNCEINVYNLTQFKHHCTIPVYNHLSTAMAINPHSNNLVIVHADQQMFEFSIVEKRYTEWSRKLQQQGLHTLWLERDTPIIHVTFNPAVPTHIILHDTYMFCIIDQSLPLPTDRSQLHNQSFLKHLSANARKNQEHAFKICKKFKPLLHVELLFDGSLVVVERPVMDINAQLPAPVRQKKFAT